MKKILLAAAVVLLATSCATTTKTARTEKAPYTMYNATAVDLQVSPERITYNYFPTREVRACGEENCKQAAINEALEANGNADILVEPQFVLHREGKKIIKVTVTGRPATYVNFRPLSDEIFNNSSYLNNNSEGTKTKKSLFF